MPRLRWILGAVGLILGAPGVVPPVCAQGLASLRPASRDPWALQDPAYLAALDRALDATETDFNPAYRQAVTLRLQFDPSPEAEAQLVVNEDLARRLLKRDDLPPTRVPLYLFQALAIARNLQDAPALIRQHRAIAETVGANGERNLAAVHARVAWEMAREIDLPTAELLPLGLFYIGMLHSAGFETETRPVFAALRQLPGADQLAIDRLATLQSTFADSAAAQDAWRRLRDLAQAHQNPVVQAEAEERIGLLLAPENPAEALAHFTAASTVAPHRPRDASALVVEARLLARADRLPAGIDLLFQDDATHGPRRPASERVLILETLSDLHHRHGNLAAAFDTLQAAHTMSRRPGFQPLTLPLTATRDSAPAGSLTTAAELAAVRNSLREAELERTRLRQRQTVGIAVTAATLAALLGLALLYKRRTAAALAIARDNAELRAERTHWQMLRYQLNPHFLFNALSSLGGLVSTDSNRAARCVDRLAEFCHLALEGAHDELRPLGQEIEQLRAYLDVEQAGAEDLHIEFAVPADVTGFLIPPLLLQPLMENALKYGAQTCEGRLEASVTVRRLANPDLLQIEITNTGAWVEADDRPRRRPAIGLANVRERLAKLDPPGRLEFAPAAGRVIARLRLPLLLATT